MKLEQVTAVLSAMLFAGGALAGDYETRVVVSGLNRPTGIASDAFGLYITQVPSPGIGGRSGGSNTLDRIFFHRWRLKNITTGEPEPPNLALDKWGRLYWTCKTAGVIVARDPEGNREVLLRDLESPMGIALDHTGRFLYFTELPTPGVPGSQGGANKVWEYDLRRMKLNLVDAGDPQPTDITVALNGNLYWTCTSAGVIVEARETKRRW